MYFVRTARWIVLLITSFTHVAVAQNQSIRGPILGFAPDAAGTAVRPILGVPGAAIVGDRLNLGTEIRNAVISPQENSALAVRSEDAQPIIVRLNPQGAVIINIVGGLVAADRIAVSPSGTAAALYADASKRLQLIRQLPSAPEVVYEFDFSAIAGAPVEIAVSDDGTLALVNFTDNGIAALWVADAAGRLWPVPSMRPSSIAFFPQRRDAIVADDETQYVFLMLALDQAATRVPLLPYTEGVHRYSGIAVSGDGRGIFLAGSESESIAVVDVETRTYAMVPCACRLTGLHVLSGTSVFRLTDGDGGPLVSLNASSSEPRIVVIPPLLPDSPAPSDVEQNPQ